ncbi:MAG: hypothetical protein R6W82_11190 [bacterium]
MRRLKMLMVLALMAGLTLGGCSDDDDGPTGPSSNVEEYNAVLGTLAANDALGPVGSYAMLVEPGEVSFGDITVGTGTLEQAVARTAERAQASGWQAFALELNISGTWEGESIDESWTGVAAWAGLDVEAQTVEEAISVYAIDTALSDGTAVIESEEAIAFYVDGTEDPEVTYVSTSGTFSISNVIFEETEACQNVAMQGISCTYAVGTVDGSFDFDATDGFSTVTRTSTFTGLPAVQINIIGSTAD